MMLSIVRASFDFERETSPGEILLFPDGGSIREAVLRLLPSEGCRLGNWTFTPKTLLSDFEKKLDLPEEMGEVEQLFLLKRIIRGNDRLAVLASNARGVSRVSDVLLALRRAGIFTGQGLYGALENAQIRPIERHEMLAGLLDDYGRELELTGRVDRPQREDLAIKLLLDRGLPPIDGLSSRVHAVWFSGIRRTDARILALLARDFDVVLYEPIDLTLFPSEKMKTALFASSRLVADYALEFGAEVREGDAPDGNSCSARGLAGAIADRSGSIDAVPVSGIAGWPVLTAFEARNSLGEAELVAGAIKLLCLEHGIKPYDITIYGEATATLKRALDAHGVPFSGGGGASIAEALPANLVEALASAVVRGFPRRELFALLAQPLMGIDNIHALDSVFCELDYHSLADIDEGDLAALSAEKAPIAGRLLDVKAGLSRVFGEAFENDVISGEAFVRMMTELMHTFDVKRGAFIWALAQPDANEALALQRSLEKLSETLGQFEGSPDDTFDRHCDLLLELCSSGESDDRAARGVRIHPLSGIFHADSRVVFVLNCVQGEVPRTEGEQLFLSPSEATLLGLSPPDSLLAGYCGLVALVTKADLAIFSRPLADGERSLPPSPVLVSLYRALDSGADAYREAVGRIREEILARPFTRKRMEIAAGTALMEPESEFSANLGKFEGIDTIADSAETVNILRDHRPFRNDKFGGIIDGEILGRLEERARNISATGLERYNTCPYWFLLEKMMKVEGLPEPEKPSDVRTVGSAFHKALEEFWNERIAGYFGNVPIEERIARVAENFDEAKNAVNVSEGNLRVAIERIPECVEAGMKKISPKVSEVRRDVFARTLRLALERYLLAVSAIDDSFVPVACEQSLLSEIGNSTLHAKIDRIDANADGGLRVIDYKSGGAKSSKDMQELKVIQIPLYFISAEAFGKVVCGQYWGGFSKRTPEFGKPLEFADEGKQDEFMQKITVHVQGLLEGIERGAFPAEPRGGSCLSYCPYAAVCGNDPENDEGEADE